MEPEERKMIRIGLRLGYIYPRRDPELWETSEEHADVIYMTEAGKQKIAQLGFDEFWRRYVTSVPAVADTAIPCRPCRDWMQCDFCTDGIAGEVKRKLEQSQKG